MNNRKRTALCLLGAALCVFMAFGAALALGRYPITPAALLAVADNDAMTHMGKPDKHHTAVRVCTSWATKDEAVEQLLADVKAL